MGKLVLLFLDLTAAFDTADHDGLYHHLTDVGDTEVCLTMALFFSP